MDGLTNVLASAGRTMMTSFVTLSIFLIPGGGLNLHQVLLFSCFAGGLSGVRKASLLALESTEQKAIDNSPQARFARDEITQLEMEQEIERQLATGKSGMEQMNLAKEFKEIPVAEWEEKYGPQVSTTRQKQHEAKVTAYNTLKSKGYPIPSDLQKAIKIPVKGYYG